MIRRFFIIIILIFVSLPTYATEPITLSDREQGLIDRLAEKQPETDQGALEQILVAAKHGENDTVIEMLYYLMKLNQGDFSKEKLTKQYVFLKKIKGYWLEKGVRDLRYLPMSELLDVNNFTPYTLVAIAFSDQEMTLDGLTEGLDHNGSDIYLRAAEFRQQLRYIGGPRLLKKFRAHSSFSAKAVRFGAQGNYLYSGGHDKRLNVWNIRDKKNPKLVESHGVERKIHALSINKAGNLLASGGFRGVIQWTIGDKGKIHEAARFNEEKWNTFALDYSRTSNLLVTSGLTFFDIWDMSDSDKPLRLGPVSDKPLRLGPINVYMTNSSDIAFHPNGEYVANALTLNSVRVWNVQSLLRGAVGDPANNSIAWFRERFDNDRNVIPPTSIAFSVDGNLLAIGWSDGFMTVWNTADIDKPQRLLLKKEHPYPLSVKSIAFDPTGKFILTATDNIIVLWNISNIENPFSITIDRLEEHSSFVNDVTFSNDGDYFASASDDDTIILWRMPHDPELSTLFLDELDDEEGR